MHNFLLLQITSNDNHNYQVGTLNITTNQPTSQTKQIY